MSGRVLGDAEFLSDPELKRVFAALDGNGEEVRIVGGAVRNALLGLPVADIDLATTSLPAETARRAEAAGLKAVNTGAEHGTITVVAGGRGFEVTTLRSDVETDGRRARVAFGRDWQRDAERRDFTINGLYARPDGTVIDPVGGLADIGTRTIRFIGDAETRIREDYLRILRFFRFFAWYGSGRPDADGLRACARLKEGISGLSAERQWAELKKLLAAPDSARALLWMRQAGVLTAVLPESEKWGIDAIHGLVRAEADLSWTPDPLLRLVAILPPDGERLASLATRLRFSRVEAERLAAYSAAPAASAKTSDAALAELLYREGVDGPRDRVRLALAAARERAQGDTGALTDAASYLRQSAFIERWQRPVFPIRGADLAESGFSGPELGRLLKALEAEWIASSFTLGRDALLARAAQMIAE